MRWTKSENAGYERRWQGLVDLPTKYPEWEVPAGVDGVCQSMPHFRMQYLNRPFGFSRFLRF